MPSVVNCRQETFANDGTDSSAPSILPDDDNYQTISSATSIENSDLSKGSFLMGTSEDRERILMKIAKDLDSYQDDLNSNRALKEFFFTAKDDTIEEIMICNDILDHIQNQDDQDQM